MRIIVKRSDILKIGKVFVRKASYSMGVVPLVNMTVSFGVNLTRLLRAGGTTVRISVYDRDVYLETRTFQASVTGDSLTTSTVSEAVEKERITQIRDELCLLKDNIDITRFISNANGRLTLKNNIKNRVEYVSVLGSSVKGKGEKISPEIPLGNAEQADERFMRSMILRGTDPAAISTIFPVMDPASVRNKSTKSDRSPARKPLAERRKYPVYSLVGAPGVYRKSYVTSDYFPVEHVVQMPRAKLSQTPKLYFHLEAISSQGLSIDYEVIQFDTQAMMIDIDRLTSNSIERDMRGIRKQSVTYTREVTPPRSNRLSYYLPLKVEKQQIENLKFGNPILLRSVKTVKSSLSTEFTSSVKLRKNPFAKTAEQGANDIPFYISRNGDDVQVRLIRVPQGVISVSLLRRDVFRKERFQVIGEPVLSSPGKNVVFIDKSTRDSSTYEYRISFIDDRSNAKLSSNSLFYHYVSSALSLPARLSIVNVAKQSITTPTGTAPTVTINVDAGTANRGIQGTREFLKSKGIDTSILGSSINDTSSYSPLPIFEVLRVNLRTGEIENLGKFSENKILDDSAVPGGKVKGVDPLNFFEKYRYIVKLGLRSPSALSTTQTSFTIDPATGNGYTYNSYKFRSRRLSTDLPSTQEMSNMAKKSVTDVNIDSVEVGIESSVNVNFDDMQPKVVGLKMRQTFVESNLISWGVSGESRLVDHFQVYAEADGVRALIGCSHAFTNDGEYRYEDRQMYDRIGKVTYSVVPIRLDFTRALGDAKISVVKDNSLPDFLQE